MDAAPGQSVANVGADVRTRMFACNALLPGRFPHLAGSAEAHYADRFTEI